MLSRGMQGALTALAVSVVLMAVVPMLNDDADWPIWMRWPFGVAVAAFSCSMLAVLVVAVRDRQQGRARGMPPAPRRPAGSTDPRTGAGR